MSALFCLRVLTSNSTRRFDLMPGDVSSVGRATEANILIPDPNISRHQMTLFVRDDHVYVEVNPQSPNQLVKNGRVAQQENLFPGEFFDIGPYRFELELKPIEVVADLTGRLPPDPAGPIDIRLASEVQRIAPRWSTVGRDAARTADEQQVKPAETQGLVRRLGLPAAAAVTMAMLAWLFVFRADAGDSDAAEAARADGDLLASVKAPACRSDDACLIQARDSVQLAEKLRQSGARDLITLYRTAKQLRLAQQALGDRDDRLPNLKASAQRAHKELMTAVADQQFQLRRAREENDIYRQLSTLQTMLGLCAEDRVPFCTDYERAYQQIRERLQQR